MYRWSSEWEAAALEESAVQIWSCRYNRASLDEGNTTASHSQIYIQKPHKYTDLLKHIWSKSWALMILTTFMKNWMCDQQLKPPSNESWLKLSVDLITLDLSNICFWYWVVIVLGSILYLSLDLYYICLWVWVVFVLGSILYLSLDIYYICLWIWVVIVFVWILFVADDSKVSDCLFLLS